ncbi:MAG: hypothetical protein V4436_03545 [Patescibacteria group bacterium]
MPLTPKGRKIEGAMKKEYGSKKGEQVFYASKNKGTIHGVEATGAKRRAMKAVKSLESLRKKPTHEVLRDMDK